MLNCPQRPHNTTNAHNAVLDNKKPRSAHTLGPESLGFQPICLSLCGSSHFFPNFFVRLGRRPESVDNRQFIPPPPPINILQQCSKCTDRVCGDVCAGQQFLMVLSSSFLRLLKQRCSSQLFSDHNAVVKFS